MNRTASAAGVVEWRPDAVGLRRARRPAVVVLVLTVTTIYGLLALEGTDRAASAFAVAGLLAYGVVAVLTVRPTATGPGPGRAPVVTDPAAVPAPAVTDQPVQRRQRLARLSAALFLVGMCLAGAQVASADGAPLLDVIAGLLGLRSVGIDATWLWTLHRRVRQPGDRTTLTVRAVGAPRRSTVVLTGSSGAWAVERDGVLHDAVAGDVLVVDGTPRPGSPVLLTLGDRRSLCPPPLRLTDRELERATAQRPDAP